MKTALITGATSGIGRAMALALHKAGYGVLALGRSQDALAELRAVAPGISTVAVDVTDRDALAAALGAWQIDVLVNNAGVMPQPGSFDTMSLEDIDRTVLVNLQAVLWLTRAVVPQMRQRQAGHIVFTGSSAAHAPGANFAVYAATKAAIAAFAAGLRGDVAASGIRVTELVPGRVETALYTQILTDETRSAMYEGGQSLQPEDVAEALVAVLGLPARADITRLDIMPTRPVPPIKLK
ncbi:SDR family oxidoreductase [Fuscibacter oryzae]|uniref:SDR family oxidoreductase n=1 Tax=Fuscibacter oryzae TaxID=2803939 RepID=A0A8J7N091_9RHOB|nr:SDR family oxidoreductase [Fuscibacter oryzae]MBL4930164.1 SDR family oxidoreductase [Fuscibacter oryzae]